MAAITISGCACVTGCIFLPAAAPRHAEDVTRSDDESSRLSDNRQLEERSKAEGFAMWLSGLLYNGLPYFYVLGGALFWSGTMYIGTTAPGATLYIASGLISIVCGGAVFVRRRVNRATIDNVDNT